MAQKVHPLSQVPTDISQPAGSHLSDGYRCLIGFGVQKLEGKARWLGGLALGGSSLSSSSLPAPPALNAAVELFS